MVNPATKAKWMPNIGGKDVANPATRTVDNATVDPTDKSIPPARMTKAIPRDTNPIIEVCRKILVKFSVVRKLSLSKLDVMKSVSKTQIIGFDRKNRLIFFATVLIPHCYILSNAQFISVEINF